MNFIPSFNRRMTLEEYETLTPDEKKEIYKLGKAVQWRFIINHRSNIRLVSKKYLLRYKTYLELYIFDYIKSIGHTSLENAGFEMRKQMQKTVEEEIQKRGYSKVEATSKVEVTEYSVFYVLMLCLVTSMVICAVLCFIFIIMYYYTN